MSAVGDARNRHQAAQAPVSRPNTAPVDSGAIGRLSDAERAEIGWAVERDWQLRDQRDDWDGLHAVVERVVREHTDRALAEVEQRIWALESCASPANEGYGDHDGCFVANALAIVRAARQEQNR